MDRKRTIEALDYIMGQLKYGYIDLDCLDEDELEIVEQSIKEYIVNHGFGGNNYDA